MVSSLENNVTIRHQDITQYPEFNQRHVMELVKIHAWTEQQTKLQLQYNRILQADYLACESSLLIKAAQLTHQNWLTDFVPLTLNAALYFNICAELLTFYQINLDDCALIASEIYLKSIKDPKLKLIENEIKTKLSSMRHETEFKDISKQTEEYNKIKEALYFIETCVRKKSLTNAYLETYLSPKVNYFAKMLAITKKPIFPKNHNNDYCITGAPGSGKSSITKELLKANKDEYISICTDDYRFFYLPTTEKFEAFNPDEQRYIRTQDTAYIIKELIALRLRLEKTILSRPNIYIDTIRLEKWQSTLVKHSHSLTSIIAGSSNVNMIPKRVYQRAETSTNPANSKRYYNTTALLTSHRLESQHILANALEETRTMVYDTCVPINQQPLLMAVINNKDENSNIIITDLSRFCDYIGKSNINVNAEFGGTLFFDGSLPKYRFTYDALYKADTLLKMIEPHAKNKNFDIFITSASNHEKPACKISYISPGVFNISVMDKELFSCMLKNLSSKTKEQFQALIMTICYGHSVRKKVEILGKNAAFMNAIKLLKLDEHLTPASNVHQTVYSFNKF